MALDLSQDWQVVDDPVAVVLFVKLAEGQFDLGTTVQGVFREEVSRELAVKLGMMEKDVTFFHMWRAKLGGKTPKNADRIQDAGGVNWTVRKVENFDRDANGVQRYRCFCVKDSN